MIRFSGYRIDFEILKVPMALAKTITTEAVKVIDISAIDYAEPDRRFPVSSRTCV